MGADPVAQPHARETPVFVLVFRHSFLRDEIAFERCGDARKDDALVAIHAPIAARHQSRHPATQKSSGLARALRSLAGAHDADHADERLALVEERLEVGAVAADVVLPARGLVGEDLFRALRLRRLAAAIILAANGIETVERRLHGLAALHAPSRGPREAGAVVDERLARVALVDDGSPKRVALLGENAARARRVARLQHGLELHER